MSFVSGLYLMVVVGLVVIGALLLVAGRRHPISIPCVPPPPPPRPRNKLRVSPTDEQLVAMVREYHGFKTDAELIEAVGYGLELQVAAMRIAFQKVFGG